MKKIIPFIIIFIMGVLILLFFLEGKYNIEHHKKVYNQITEYLYENYQKDQIEEIIPVYDSKIRDKDMKYTVVVKFKKDKDNDKYTEYILKKGKVTKTGVFETKKLKSAF